MTIAQLFSRTTAKVFRRRPALRLVSVLAAVVVLVASCGGSGDFGDAGDFTESGAEAGGLDEAAAEEMAPAEDAERSTANQQVDASNAQVDDTAGDEAGSADTDAEAADGESADQPESDEPGSAGASPTGLTAADLQRDIVFTANVTVAVDDVSAAGEEAVAAIDQVGGFVFGQESTGGSDATSTFIFKVLPQDFEDALAALGGIGQLTNQTVSADDVTERVVDLRSRITIAELGVERLRNAAEATTNFEDFAEIEELLLERETELEVMRGQLRTLQDQVNLATITLVLTQDRVQNNLELLVTVYEEHDSGLGCPGQQDSRVEADIDLTVCFELLNSGDQTLTDLTLTDTGLGIDADSTLIDVFGSLDEPLLPGQSIIIAFETNPERDLRLRTRAGGQPTAVEGEEPAGPPVSAVNNLTIDVQASQQDPGFDDGFSAGRDVLASVWVVVRVVVGFLIPMLVFLPFLLALWWISKRIGEWRKAKRDERLSTIPAPMPGPGPVPVGVTEPASTTPAENPTPPESPTPPPPPLVG